MYFGLILLLLTTPLLKGQNRSVATRSTATPLPTRQIPSPIYYAGLDLYRRGDVVSALEAFETADRLTLRTNDGRWLDSVPALAMRAECLYQLGDCVGAAEAIDHILSICSIEDLWMSRVFWEGLPSGGERITDNRDLWPSAASVNVIPLQRAVSFVAGGKVTRYLHMAEDDESAGLLRKHGGGRPKLDRRQQQEWRQHLLACNWHLLPSLDPTSRFQPQITTPQNINIGELMRCVSVAMYRRRILNGPLSIGDPLVNSTLDSIRYPVDLRDPLARSMIGSMRGAGYLANGSDQRAAAAFASASVNGSVHDLSAIAMMTSLYTNANDDRVADKVAGCIQAANVAAALRQTDWIGPAVQMAAGYADPNTAAEVASFAATASSMTAKDSEMASMHCAVAAADAMITAGQADAAQRMLVHASTIAGKRDVHCPRIEAYAAWVTARLAASVSSGANGGRFGGSARTSPSASAAMMDPAISPPLAKLAAFAAGDRNAIGFRDKSNQGDLVTLPRVFQIHRLSGLLATKGQLPGTDELVTEYLQDAPQWVWRTDPVDAIGSANHDKMPLHRARMMLAIRSGDASQIWRAGNDYSIDRFLRSMPIGGRAASVRKMAWADIDQLDSPTRSFIESSSAIRQLRAEVLRLGADPNAAAGLRVAANNIALTAGHLPPAVLPKLGETDVTLDMPADTAVLSIFKIDDVFQFVMLTDGRLRQWHVNADQITDLASHYLTSLGVLRKSARIPRDQTDLAVRHTTGDRLARAMFPDDQLWKMAKEKNLAIVPDDILWYLPFETLPMPAPVDRDGSEIVSLGDRYSIQYAPTIGSLRFPAGPAASNQTVALAAGEFFWSRNDAQNEAVIGRLASLPGVDIDALRTIPSARIGTVAQHAVFAGLVQPDIADPISLVPSKDGPSGIDATMAAWMSFPHAPPSSVLLAGIRSRIASGGHGNEIFQLLCGLRVAGVRDAVVCRWFVGGESTAALVEEYLREVTASSPSVAFSRTRMLLRQRPINPSAEPLLSKREAGREDITANDPLFWAGYIPAH